MGGFISKCFLMNSSYLSDCPAKFISEISSVCYREVCDLLASQQSFSVGNKTLAHICVTSVYGLGYSFSIQAREGIHTAFKTSECLK